MTANEPALDVERAVAERYSGGAVAREAALCCPVSYEPKWLEVIPAEVIERDYGCGDPSKYVRAGETVLDLGSGTGKICFIASQVVGAEGKVVGIDMTHEMLEVARRNAPIVGTRIGYDNVEFRRGRIQDLRTNLDQVDALLADRPVRSADDLHALDQEMQRLRETSPLVDSESVDVVVSNCVLNLVPSADKPTLFREIHRVLRRRGRAVISDIVSDEPVTEQMQQDADLWSGCISGALTESEFLRAFEDAGFYGIRVLEREAEPWQTVEGIEFRSVVIEAFKGKEGPCHDRRQAVIYRGPFREVVDDDGHRIRRGERTAVCAKTFEIFRTEPYAEHFDPVEPLNPVPPGDARPFDCGPDTLRHPKETKGHDYDATIQAKSDCC